MLTSLSHHSARRRAWLPVLGPIVLAATLAAGCSSSSPTPAPASSGAAGSGSNTSFRQCLQKQGVSLPSGGRPSPGSGQPQARPTGSAASAFRKAMQACGGGRGFGGGGFGGGGNPAG
jgi:hypothetical protein